MVSALAAGSAVYDQAWQEASCDGTLSYDKAMALLATSGLKASKLRRLWRRAHDDGTAEPTRASFVIALGLVALAQAGERVTVPSLARAAAAGRILKPQLSLGAVSSGADVEMPIEKANPFALDTEVDGGDPGLPGVYSRISNVLLAAGTKTSVSGADALPVFMQSGLKKRKLGKVRAGVHGRG